MKIKLRENKEVAKLLEDKSAKHRKPEATFPWQATLPPAFLGSGKIFQATAYPP